MMFYFHPKEESYRVTLHRIGGHTEEEKARFCREVSDNYGIPLSLMRKIADRCPIVIKKDLPFKKAKLLAIAFKSFGASVSVERKRNLFPIFLEFATGGNWRLELESSHLRKSPGGAWQVFGRVKNISDEELHDTWALIQLFDEFEELIAFEEISLPINPLPPNASSPLKVIFEGDLPVQKISIAFKSASGNPLQTREKRERREWSEVSIAELGKRGSPPPPAEITEKVLPPIEPQLSLIPERGEERLEEEATQWASEEISFPEPEGLPLETEGDIRSGGEELTPGLLEEGRQQEEERFEILPEEEGTPEVIQSLIEKEEEIPEEEELHLDYPADDRIEDTRRIESDLSLFGEGDRVTGEHPVVVEEKRGEEAILYPWIEDFRKAVEAYEHMYRDPFAVWFENVQKENGFESAYHSLLTLLIYARFNQTHSSDAALENTRKVFKLSLQTDLPLSEIPPLEGTPFFSGEAWRDLYFRAIPKLQEVSFRILERMEWEPIDLDRLIRIIPHMTDRNSLGAIRFIHERVPGIIKDIFKMPVDISEGLYRVASRLGVVNPLFDYYQGRNSMGDLKIQSFARIAFPEDPGKIEDPMSRIGVEDEGGYCFPIEPQCQQCLFDAFCPKLFPGFNPSEKGMVFRS